MGSLSVGKTLDFERVRIVAVDGPAGSGKSSICEMVAQKVGWTYLSTGSLYRATGILARDMHVDLEDEQAVASFMEDVKSGLRWNGETRRLLFGDRDLSPLLGLEETGAAASKIATNPVVRASLLPLQRDVIRTSESRGALVDGRDIGTVVFPNADLKIFLTASLEERAKRRLAQLSDNEASLEDLMAEMKSRDDQDADRDTAPLKKAEDAIVVDTSNMSLEQVVQYLIEMMQQAKLLD